ncbi:MAG TPA: GNAT family protein [Candidatus Thermoplasmatota archaeon]|nr:GNAT family protein [Candidatus Thermoplasmatota archaeon]
MDVVLRPVMPTDVVAFFPHWIDPRSRHQAAFVDATPPDRAAFDARWARILADPANVNRTILVDGTIAGHVAGFPLHGRPNVTYWLGREWWGRGVATRALRLFLAEHRERPLFASAAADNAGSIRVLEKCGFRRVGTTRGEAGARGGVIDEALFELRS